MEIKNKPNFLKNLLHPFIRTLDEGPKEKKKQAKQKQKVKNANLPYFA
jgi:hypothetical protein